MLLSAVDCCCGILHGRHILGPHVIKLASFKYWPCRITSYTSHIVVTQYIFEWIVPNHSKNHLLIYCNSIVYPRHQQSKVVWRFQTLPDWLTKLFPYLEGSAEPVSSFDLPWKAVNVFPHSGFQHLKPSFKIIFDETKSTSNLTFKMLLYKTVCFRFSSTPRGLGTGNMMSAQFT